MLPPKFIEVRNAAGEKAAFLSPKTDGIKDDWVDRRLNAESTLKFSLPLISEKIAELTPECRIYPGNGCEYMLLRDDAIDYIRDEKGAIWATIMAEESWKLLNREFVTVRNDSPDPPSNLHTVIIVSGGEKIPAENPYEPGTAGHALHALMYYNEWEDNPSWTIGIVDVEGVHDLETEKISLLENIKQIQDTWGGFLVWDSINHVVHLRSEASWQNYTGFQVRYGKNQKSVTRTQSNRLVTRLYAYGADDLNFSSINDDKEYVENFSYTSWTYKDTISNPDIYDQQELKDWAEKELLKMCHPKYRYSVKMLDLQVKEEYSHETFALGDMADVIDHGVLANDKVRIIRHAHGVFRPWNCELDLGEPEQRLAQTIADASKGAKYLKGIVDSTGRISGYNLVDGSIISNHIANAALEASKFNTKQIILTDDTWTDNSPSGGYVSWNSHKLFYNGYEYAILASNTNKKYIVWQKDINSNYYQTYTEEEFAAITLADYDFVIAVNNTGIHDIAWYNRIARQFIGSAFIADAAIKTAHIGEAQIVNAHIANLEVSKITSGIIQSADISVGASQKFVLSGINQNLAVSDANRQRVILGKNGSDYGIWVYSAAGQEILSASGLGVNVVGNNQVIDGSIESVKIKNLSANLINAVNGIVLGSNATINWNEVAAPTAVQVGARPYDWNPAYGDISGTKPPSNADNTNSAIGSNRLTYIDGDGIYTGTLTAQQINVIQGITLGANANIQWASLPSLPSASQIGARADTWTPSYSQVTGTKPPTDADNTYGTIGASRLTYIGSTGIYTGTLTATQINAVDVYAKRLLHPSNTSNYGVIGGSYSDLELWRGGTNWFKIYDQGPSGGPAGEFRCGGSNFLSFSSSGASPRGTWDFNLSGNVKSLEEYGYVYCSNSSGTKSTSTNIGIRINGTNVAFYQDGSYIGYVALG